MNYIFHILIMINIYIILTLSTNLLLGMTNMLSLGQAAFYGIGAYLTVFALEILGLPLIPALLFVIILTALSSLVVAYSSLRLKGDYFVLTTLGFQLIIYTILYNWVAVTKGPFGISGIPAPKLFGVFVISGIIPYLILSSALTFAIIWLFYKLIHSPFGQVLKGLREDELAMKALGRDVTQYKIQVFLIASGFIGISGFLYATYTSYIDPTSFNLDEAIFILAALILGGPGNIKGPIAGAVFVVILPEILRFIGLPDAIAANMRQIIYGLIIILLMRYRPRGLAGNYVLK